MLYLPPSRFFNLTLNILFFTITLFPFFRVSFNCSIKNLPLQVFDYTGDYLAYLTLLEIFYILLLLIFFYSTQEKLKRKKQQIVQI